MRREQLGITQTALADMIGESKQTIYKYESGVVSNIPSDKIEAIANALDVSPAASGHLVALPALSGLGQPYRLYRADGLPPRLLVDDPAHCGFFHLRHWF